MTDRETLRILVIRDGEMLVAQCLEHDICTQAEDIDQLQERMEKLIDLERVESAERTGQDFGDIEAAPEEFHNMWDRAKMFADTGSPFSMALAA